MKNRNKKRYKMELRKEMKTKKKREMNQQMMDLMTMMKSMEVTILEMMMDQKEMQGITIDSSLTLIKILNFKIQVNNLQIKCFS